MCGVISGRNVYIDCNWCGKILLFHLSKRSSNNRLKNISFAYYLYEFY